MKKAGIIFTMIFVVVAINAMAQDTLKSFIIKKEINNLNGKPYLLYIDPAKKENYTAAKDGKGETVGLSGIEFNSVERLHQIELKIFSQEEIKYLEPNMGSADCIISSSGKIISVSFIFHGWETKVPVTKLEEYAAQIKENITFKLTY